MIMSKFLHTESKFQVTKSNFEILSRNVEILSRNFELLSRNFELLSRNFELPYIINKKYAWLLYSSVHTSAGKYSPSMVCSEPLTSSGPK